MLVNLNPHIQQTSPNGNQFRVSAIRLIKRSWNSYETHALIVKESGDMQILVLDSKNNHKTVFKHPSVDYDTTYGKF